MKPWFILFALAGASLAQEAPPPDKELDAIAQSLKQQFKAGAKTATAGYQEKLAALEDSLTRRGDAAGAKLVKAERDRAGQAPTTFRPTSAEPAKPFATEEELAQPLLVGAATLSPDTKLDAASGFLPLGPQPNARLEWKAPHLAPGRYWIRLYYTPTEAGKVGVPLRFTFGDFVFNLRLDPSPTASGEMTATAAEFVLTGPSPSTARLDVPLTAPVPPAVLLQGFRFKPVP